MKSGPSARFQGPGMPEMPSVPRVSQISFEATQPHHLGEAERDDGEIVVAQARGRERDDEPGRGAGRRASVQPAGNRRRRPTLVGSAEA